MTNLEYPFSVDWGPTSADESQRVMLGNNLIDISLNYYSGERDQYDLSTAGLDVIYIDIAGQDISLSVDETRCLINRLEETLLAAERQRAGHDD